MQEVQYSLPSIVDDESNDVTVRHTTLPPFVTFKDDTYTIKPRLAGHVGFFSVVGILTDT